MTIQQELNAARAEIKVLTAQLAAKEEELVNLNESYDTLGRELEGEQAKLGDSLRESLLPFAEIMAQNGTIHPTPHAKYRWIEEQVRAAGCE